MPVHVSEGVIPCESMHEIEELVSSIPCRVRKLGPAIVVQVSGISSGGHYIDRVNPHVEDLVVQYALPFY